MTLVETLSRPALLEKPAELEIVRRVHPEQPVPADALVGGASYKVERPDPAAAPPPVEVHLVGARPEEVHLRERRQERGLQDRHGALVGDDRQVIEAAPAEPVKAAPEPAESSPPAATPVFRTRADLGKPAPAPIPAVIPIVRAPDDPGIDDEGPSDEFAEQIGAPRVHGKVQAGGWRGFWSRWGA